jgi:hypothetical protein
MRLRSVVSTVCGAVFVSCLVAGCGENNNTGKDTDIARLALPTGVSDQPVSKPYKSRASRSAPALAQNPSAN